MKSRADIAAAERLSHRPLRTFDEVFARHNLTQAERAALVWHLAAYRARKTVEALLPKQQVETWMLDILR